MNIMKHNGLSYLIDTFYVIQPEIARHLVQAEEEKMKFIFKMGNSEDIEENPIIFRKSI